MNERRRLEPDGYHDASPQHRDVQTTLTFADDGAAKLKAKSRRAGRPLKEVVNVMLRVGLSSRRAVGKQQAFKFTPRDLGDLRPGLSIDAIGELIVRPGRFLRYETAPPLILSSEGLRRVVH